MAAGRSRQKGRGALSNASGRFESIRVENDLSSDLADERPFRSTVVHTDAPRAVLSTNDSPDIPFDVSLNPYRGCEHGCIYCYARPSHAYLGLSPGLDFETQIFAKRDAADRLREAMRRRGYRPRVIALGANTDPYQPIEADLRITETLLEVFREARHPVTVVTKSAGVVRDVEVLAELASEGLASVSVSITTLDPELARRMEPRASTPSRRLEAVRVLSDAGIPVTVLVSPIVPALNDHELEAVVEAAGAAGATAASYLVLRLPGEVAALFFEWLETHYPARAARVRSLLEQMHGGQIYRSRFGLRMRGSGAYAEMLRARFELVRRRLRLASGSPDLRCDLFRPPGLPAAGAAAQLVLALGEPAGLARGRRLG